MPGPQTDYRELLRQGRALFGDVRIGRPGYGRPYWMLYLLAQLLRVRYRIRVTGIESVASGPAILIGNHLSLMDPIMVGISAHWRVCFFTKEEVFESPGAFFFRWSGQIPLRRGDEEATRWALAMSAAVVASGQKLCVYPEATRSPDSVSLHRLHRRVLVPVLQANPDVPVHLMAIAYPGRRLGRRIVDLRFSPALDLDAAAMDANQLTDLVRDQILELGGMPYVHAFGRSVKERDRT